MVKETQLLDYMSQRLKVSMKKIKIEVKRLESNSYWPNKGLYARKKHLKIKEAITLK